VAPGDAQTKQADAEVRPGGPLDEARGKQAASATQETGSYRADAIKVMLGVEFTLHPCGRPRKEAKKQHVPFPRRLPEWIDQ